MSVSESLTITPPAATSSTPESKRAWWASALARYTSKRREELGITLARAAELSGLELSEWCSLESGWIPEDMNRLRAIAATLRGRWSDYSLLALLASCHQDCC